MITDRRTGRLPRPLVALVVGTFVSVVGDSVASLALILDAERRPRAGVVLRRRRGDPRLPRPRGAGGPGQRLRGGLLGGGVPPHPRARGRRRPPTVGSTWLLAANAVSFFVVAGLVLGLVRAHPREPLAVAPPLWRDAGGGFVALRASPTVWLMLGLFAGVVAATSMEGVAGVFYLREVTGSDAVFGLLLSAWSLGAIPGSLLAGHRLLLGPGRPTWWA